MPQIETGLHEPDAAVTVSKQLHPMKKVLSANVRIYTKVSTSILLTLCPLNLCNTFPE